jgi:pimeloyl-ACP methyl ester carboxylesterase
MAIPAGQLAEQVRCGWVTLPETRGSKDGRTIRLPVAVLKSTAADPEPDPVIYLTGGPGAPALQEALQYWGRIENADFIQSRRDYIFFDQRGTGLSQPALYCPEIDRVLLDGLRLGLRGGELRRLNNERQPLCRERLVAQGIDLSVYNSVASAYDIADLVDALGYDAYNLFGTSYGTRLALTAMRVTPDRIRTVILDSVIPPQVDLAAEMPRNAERAINVLFAGCRNDTRCNLAYPDAQALSAENVRRANAEPIRVTINDESGAPVEIRITSDFLVQGAFGALYSRDLFRLIPFASDEITRGEYGIVQAIA